MDLLKCPRCGEEYSPSYRRCPFCEEGDHPRKVKHNSGKHNSGKQNGGRRVSDKKQTHSARGAMAAVLVVVLLLAAQFGGLWLWAVVVAAAAVVLWRRDCRLRGKGLFAAGLLLASAGYVALIDKAAPFEADRYYVVIYAAVVLAVAVVLALSLIHISEPTRPY